MHLALMPQKKRRGGGGGRVARSVNECARNTRYNTPMMATTPPGIIFLDRSARGPIAATSVAAVTAPEDGRCQNRQNQHKIAKNRSVFSVFRETNTRSVWEWTGGSCSERPDWRNGNWKVTTNRQRTEPVPSFGAVVRDGVWRVCFPEGEHRRREKMEKEMGWAGGGGTRGRERHREVRFEPPKNKIMWIRWNEGKRTV